MLLHICHVLLLNREGGGGDSIKPKIASVFLSGLAWLKDMGIFDFNLRAARNRRFEGLVSDLVLSRETQSTNQEATACPHPVDERKWPNRLLR